MEFFRPMKKPVFSDGLTGCDGFFGLGPTGPLPMAMDPDGHEELEG